MPRVIKGDHYLGLVSSRTVADDVIEHQHLKEYFHARNDSDARRRLTAISTIVVDKNQFVTVTVRAKEPTTAANIANEYVSALYSLDHSLSIAESDHRRDFFETPLEQEKNKLADAEEALKRAQQKTGMVLPEAQVRLGVASYLGVEARDYSARSTTSGAANRRDRAESAGDPVEVADRQPAGAGGPHAGAERWDRYECFEGADARVDDGGGAAGT